MSMYRSIKGEKYRNDEHTICSQEVKNCSKKKYPSIEVFDVARLVNSWPLKEAIFARMLDEEDPMRALGGVELSPQEYREWEISFDYANDVRK